MVQIYIFDLAADLAGFELSTFELTRRCHTDRATRPDESRLLVTQAGDAFTRGNELTAKKQI